MENDNKTSELEKRVENLEKIISDMQDLVNKLWLERRLLVIKTTTGDPAVGVEGLFCTNTYDDTFKVYAEGAWRSLATW